MIQLTTPRGLPVSVPENLTEDVTPCFKVGNWRAAKEYYEENGYVVFSRLIAPEMCVRIRDLWDREFTGYMYRQASSGRAEKHLKNENGCVMNRILNLQSVDPSRFPGFRKYATERILVNDRLRDALAALLGSPPKIVQSMHFEGNSETWEHQDSYYLDSETVGETCGVWLAVGGLANRPVPAPGSLHNQRAEHTARQGAVAAEMPVPSPSLRRDRQRSVLHARPTRIASSIARAAMQG